MLHDFLNWVTTLKYANDRKILTSVSREIYHIVPRNVKTVNDNLDRIEKLLEQEITTTKLDEFL